MNEKKRVLFLCVGNSCRSQMAEGLLRHMAPERFDVHSAGAEVHGLNPKAVKAMAEIGVDISGHHSKLVDEFARQAFDWVVTVCDNPKNACPVFLGEAGRSIHMPFDDPAHATGNEDEVFEVFRRVRDEIKAQLESLITEESEVTS